MFSSKYKPTTVLTRITLLILLLCGIIYSSAAQTTPATQTVSYTKADTARAVRAMFEQRRSSARALTAVGGTTLALGAASAVGGAVQEDGLVGAFLLGNALVLSAVGVPLFIVGRNRHKEVTAAQETATLAAYEQGERLPPVVIQRLKRRHFIAN